MSTIFASHFYLPQFTVHILLYHYAFLVRIPLQLDVLILLGLRGKLSTFLICIRLIADI
jgi:hypothetical protein